MGPNVSPMPSRRTRNSADLNAGLAADMLTTAAQHARLASIATAASHTMRTPNHLRTAIETAEAAVRLLRDVAAGIRAG